MTNLLGVAWKLTEAERKLLVEVMRRYGPEKLVIDYNDIKRIAFLDCERVIAALGHDYSIRRRIAARALANKLKRYEHEMIEASASMTTEI